MSITVLAKGDVVKAIASSAALVLLAACGRSPTEAPAPALADSALAQAPAPPIPVADSNVQPPEDSSTSSHTALTGDHRSEGDPADLEPLAEKVTSCSGVSGSFPWDYVDEPRALVLGRAKRDGNTLRVGGETLVDYGPIVVDGVETEHDQAFHYFGVLKRVGLDIVYVAGPEATSYRIVDASTSTSVAVKGLPIGSPSGQYLVALGVDDMNWVGLEIIERGKSGLKVVAKIEMQTYPCGLKWLNDTRATFHELKPAASPRHVGGAWKDATKTNLGPAFLELRDGQWAYTPASD